MPGSSLQLVVIDRIPFPRPDDPLASARQRAVAAHGGNGFMSVAATQAALLLAQGTGRLLRTMTDRGVVAVLDPRLSTARYAGFLRASLPPYWSTTDPAGRARCASPAGRQRGRGRRCRGSRRRPSEPAWDGLASGHRVKNPVSFFCQQIRVADSRLGDMTTTQTQEQVTIPEGEFEVRAIDEDVVAQLRVSDDAGHAPRVIVHAEGGSPLRCCLRAARRGSGSRWCPMRRSGGGRTRPAPTLGPTTKSGRCSSTRSRATGRPGAGTRRTSSGRRGCSVPTGADGSIRGGRLASGDELEDQAAAGRVLSGLFADPEVAVVHARALEFGCFTFEVRRAAV